MSSGRGGDGLKESQSPTTQSSDQAAILADLEKGDAGARSTATGVKETPLREEREGSQKKQEEQEKAAYSTLMDRLGKVEERNGRGIYGVLFEVSLICGLTAIMACTLALEGWKHHRFLGLRMWQYVMMAMILLAGLSIIRFVTYTLFSAATCLWRLHRDLGYFLKEIKMTVDVTIWFCAVLFAWYVWFRPRLKHVDGHISLLVATQITRFLIALCLGAGLWLGKNALFHWLVADLHYRQLCDRITRTCIQLHVIQILHNYGMWRFLTHVEDRLKIQDLIDQKLKPNKGVEEKTPKTGDSKEEEEEESEEKLWIKGYNISNELLWVKKETVPVLILQRLCKEYKNQINLKPLPVSKEMIQNPEDLMEQASNLFFRVKNRNTTPTHGDHHHHPTTCNPTSTDDDDEITLKELQEKYKTTVNAKEVELLFRRFRGKKCDEYIKTPPFDQKNIKTPQNDKGCWLAGLLSSLTPFFGLGKQLAASGNGHCKKENDDEERTTIGRDAFCSSDEEWTTIGRDEFCSWAVQAYRNCWGLESTLKSSEQIILKLNRMMIAFVLLLALIIWLLLSEIVDSAQIALLFSPLLAAKFIFSESTKNMFDGLIFALAMHPFNPGDRVVIEGMELLVTEINILSTTFYKYQTGEELVYPNSALATTQIINLELIPDQSDKLEFTIPIDTPLEDIRDLEIKIQMSLNERKDAFNSKVVKIGIGYDNIKMAAHFSYISSYLTSELKARHKSDMLTMIMLLTSKMNRRSEKKLLDSNMEAAPSNTPPPPSVGKPYIVTVKLHDQKVKLELVEEMIKPAIERSVKKIREGWEYKVVMNNVTKRTVSMAFYVWKKNSENHHDLHQELISREDLEDLQTRILREMEHIKYESPSSPKVEQGYSHRDEASSSSGGDGDKTASRDELISSNGDGHKSASSSGTGMDTGNSSGDGHASGSKPGSKLEVHIQPMPGVLDIIWKEEKVDNKKQIEVIENAIKRYFYKQNFEDDFEVKIDTEKKTVEIYAWRKFSHGIEKENQFPMEKILQKLDDFKPILDKQLDPIHGLPSVKIRDIISTLKAQVKGDA